MTVEIGDAALDRGESEQINEFLRKEKEPYELVLRLAGGSQGSVYLGYSPGPKDSRIKHAFKVLGRTHLQTGSEDLKTADLPRLQREEVLHERHLAALLENEVSLLSELDSKNIVRIQRYVPAGPYLLLVTELIDGVDLHRLCEFVRRNPSRDRSDVMGLPVTAAANIIIQAATGLKVAHRIGKQDVAGGAPARPVVHQDIKPQNLMVTHEGQVKIIDFGIARFHQKADGWFPGTERYMAPEQLRETETSPKSDIYSLGLVFYELLTLQPFYHGPRVTSGSEAEALAYLEARLAALPLEARALSGILARVLHPNPYQRPHAEPLIATLRDTVPGATEAAVEVYIQGVFRRMESKGQRPMVSTWSIQTPKRPPPDPSRLPLPSLIGEQTLPAAPKVEERLRPLRPWLVAAGAVVAALLFCLALAFFVLGPPWPPRFRGGSSAPADPAEDRARAADHVAPTPSMQIKGSGSPTQPPGSVKTALTEVTSGSQAERGGGASVKATANTGAKSGRDGQGTSRASATGGPGKKDGTKPKQNHNKTTTGAGTKVSSTTGGAAAPPEGASDASRVPASAPGMISFREISFADGHTPVVTRLDGALAGERMPGEQNSALFHVPPGSYRVVYQYEGCQDMNSTLTIQPAGHWQIDRTMSDCR